MTDTGSPDPPQLRMPQVLIDRARALVGVVDTDGSLLQGWEPPTPRDAATVVLVHDAASGIEVLLQRRLKTMSFAAGMYVFPGGAVEDGDRQAASEIASANGFGMDTLSARYAAVRETSEECGIELADPSTLGYFAHWVTPEVEERRFDTRFYAATVSPDALDKANDESDRSVWIAPADALAQYSAREMSMLPPTVAALDMFAQAAADGLDAAGCVAQVSATEVVPFLPSAVADQDQPDGIRWVLIDVRTGKSVEHLLGPPAGSESRGVHG